MVGVRAKVEADPLEDLEEAVNKAVSVGCSRGDIVERVKTTLIEERSEIKPEGAFVLNEDGTERIYYKVPEGMIDLSTAAEQYNIPTSRVRRWVVMGRVPSQGRLRGKAPGGGSYLVLESDVVELIMNPPKPPGRPRKQDKQDIQV